MDKQIFLVRQQFAQCVFNHKIHEKANDRLLNLLHYYKCFKIIFIFLVPSFLVLNLLFPECKIFIYIPIALTILEIVFNFIQKEFPFEEQAKNHKKSALQFLRLRDEYKNFISDIMYGKLDENEIKLKRDYLQREYYVICELTLDTTYKDYLKTQNNLLWKDNKSEEFTWSDDEINRFLPKELRI